MDNLFSCLLTFHDALHDFIWGPVMLFAFLAAGCLFTAGTGFFQFRRLRLWMRLTAGSLLPRAGSKNGPRLAAFSRKQKKRGPAAGSENGHISPFASMCTALAATMGTGNIVGVATAITAGGPGSIFWMWVSAALGMMTIYAENLLGSKYRYRDSAGTWHGGPMVYMDRGLGPSFHWMASLFAFFCLTASFGMGNMAQANSIAQGLEDSFSIPPVWTAVCLTVLLSFVILGNLERISAVTSRIVPFMSFLYLGGCLFILFCQLPRLPEAFSLIFREAFSLRAAGGGALGYGVTAALRIGISRGVFSNEAGLGSSVFAHTASSVKEPAEQGMWGIFEVFADTIVVCTLTALVILTSRCYDFQSFLHIVQAGQEPVSGIALTGGAFAERIPAGRQLLGICILLFAFATMTGWSYFGASCARYLFGRRGVVPYQFLFLCFTFLGCVTSLNVVWDISDTCNGLMAIPNLIAVTLLSGTVFRETRRYLRSHPPSGRV